MIHMNPPRPSSQTSQTATYIWVSLSFCILSLKEHVDVDTLSDSSDAFGAVNIGLPRTVPDG